MNGLDIEVQDAIDFHRIVRDAVWNLDRQQRSVARTMAWERVKGELRSVFQTYWDPDDRVKAAKLRKLAEEFIGRVEDEGLLD